MLIKYLKLGSFIAAGYQGAVHEIFDEHGKRYAIKVVKIKEKYKEQSYEISAWREIDFANTVGNLYPNSFIYMYAYDIIDNIGDFNYHRPKKHPNTELYNQLKKSKYAVRIVYTYINDTLDKVIHSLSREQLYSMIVQITFAIKVMHEHGYTHNDLKLHNIGAKHTSDKYVDLDDTLRVKTYGFIYKIIDYGGILHRKYDLSETSSKIHHNKMIKEVDFILYNLFRCDIKDKFFCGGIYPKDGTFKESHVYKNIEHYTSIWDYQYFLFAILYPTQHQKFFTKNINHNTSDIKLLLPFKDILHFIKFKRHTGKIINYFSSLI
jgi:serine/threonine protein kinase